MILGHRAWKPDLHSRRDWARYVHFDGSMYYYDRRHRFLTTADITNEKTYRRYEDALLKINDRISRIPLYYSHEQTLVITDIEEPESRSTFILDYRQGLYITPFSSNGDRNGTPLMHAMLQY